MHGAALRIDAADLVATAGCGITLEALHERLAAHGVWVALDGPFHPEESLGTALENGAAGPLAALYGPPRDQVIGATFVAGPGTVVKTGGRVVKNVAGFDLAKLLVGGQGAFGRLRSVNLRLRARPEADASRAFLGTREAIAAASSRLMTGGAMLAAFEVLSPGMSRQLLGEAQWALLVRAMGSAAGAAEELDAAALLIEGCDVLPVVPDDVWSRWREQGASPVVVARIGADPSSWPDAMDLAERCGGRPLCATVPRGTVRAAFAEQSAARLLELRDGAARLGWPVTLERADAAMRESAGTWGAMNAGTLRIARALRAALHDGDPAVSPWIEGAAVHA
jgi:glycolate oxidase FAD binding subunit